MSEKEDGDVIIKYNNLNKRLKKFGMKVEPWGYLAVCLESNSHSGYIINNVDDINVIEGFVKGLEYTEESNLNDSKLLDWCGWNCQKLELDGLSWRVDDNDKQSSLRKAIIKAIENSKEA